MNAIKSLAKINYWSRFERCCTPILKLHRNESSLVSIIENSKNGTASLILQRPPVNSLNLELLQDITTSIKELENNKIRGCVITSSSPTIFSSGLDIMELYKPEKKRFKAFWKSLQEMWKTLYLTPLITIAAINGHAPAGGCMIALSCDYRIMVNDKFSIGMNETQLGIVPPKWFQTLIVSTAGYRQAEKALMLGTLFSPEQALSIGLVDELASNKESLQEKVSAQMELWLKVPNAARQATKMSLRKGAIDKFCAYQDEELEYITSVIHSEIMQKPLEKYLQNLKNKKQ